MDHFFKIFCLLTMFNMVQIPMGCRQLNLPKIEQNSSEVLINRGVEANLEDPIVRSVVMIGHNVNQKRELLCTGVAVAKRLILTAAHCVVGMGSLLVFSHHQTWNLGEQYSVVRVFLPRQGVPNLATFNHAHDLAGLILAQDINDQFTKIARLPQPSDAKMKFIHGDPKAKNACITMMQIGGGLHEQNKNPQGILHTAMSQLKDGEYFDGHHGPMIAVELFSNFGDSGGPLFAQDSTNRWVVVGVLALADHKHALNLYVPLMDHDEFISQAIAASIAVPRGS